MKIIPFPSILGRKLYMCSRNNIMEEMLVAGGVIGYGKMVKLKSGR